MIKKGSIALYVRTACRVKQDISKQLDQLKLFVEREGYTQYEIYFDDGFSGNDLCRPAFWKMVVDAQLKKFDVIAVASIDRIARSYCLYKQAIAFFEERGIGIIGMDGYSSKRKPYIPVLLETISSAFTQAWK